MGDDPKEEPIDIDDFGDIVDVIGGEIPGVGTIRRIYALIKRRLSKEYIEEIKRLKKENDVLLRSMNENVALAQIVREYAAELESKIQELETKLKDREGTS